MASSRLEVDLGAIERNLAVVRGVLERARNAGAAAPTAPSGGRWHGAAVCAVLKQDAYGAGAVRIGKRLAAVGGGGVGTVAVYALDEARALAESVPGVNILVLMPVYGIDRKDALYRHLATGRVHLTLHSGEQFEALHDMAARIGVQAPLHVQVDTGLSRGGSGPEESARLVERVVGSTKVRLGGLMTHFASPCSDDQFTREQARLFRDFVETIRPTVKAAVERGTTLGARAGGSGSMGFVVHAANSAAMFRSHAYHGSMVRIGQCLLGYCGDEIEHREQFEFRNAMDDLEPAVRWVTTVAHVQEIGAGWPVGYGSTWRAPARADGRKTRIALIPVGYADGLPRNVGGCGWVGFTGRAYDRRGIQETDDAIRAALEGTGEPVLAPIVGRVSMDQITVDVTDVPEPYLRHTRTGTEMIGPEVEIYSRRTGARNSVAGMAKAAGTITHELLCRVSARVERVYKSPIVVETAPERAAAGSLRLGPVVRAGVSVRGVGGAAVA